MKRLPHNVNSFSVCAADSHAERGRCVPRVQRGYTLVEVLIVVAIVGIAGAIVVPQMLAAGTLGVQAAARVIIADLLYAQNEAIAQQEERGVVFDVANDSYSLTKPRADGTPGTEVLTENWKGGATENYVVSFVDDSRFRGVRIISADFGGSPGLTFDDLGTPDSGGTVVVEYDGERYQITVAAFTGRVTVARL